MSVLKAQSRAWSEARRWTSMRIDVVSETLHSAFKLQIVYISCDNSASRLRQIGWPRILSILGNNLNALQLIDTSFICNMVEIVAFVSENYQALWNLAFLPRYSKPNCFWTVYKVSPVQAKKCRMPFQIQKTTEWTGRAHNVMQKRISCYKVGDLDFSVAHAGLRPDMIVTSFALSI